MKACPYCGRKNEDIETNCRECGVKFEQGSPSSSPGWPSLSLLPRSAAEWTRSFAIPLFIACAVILLWAFAEGFGHNRVWHYAGPAITNQLLPLLGMALGLTCLLGQGLQKGFRILALILAFLSVVGGV